MKTYVHTETVTRMCIATLCVNNLHVPQLMNAKPKCDISMQCNIINNIAIIEKE